MPLYMLDVGQYYLLAVPNRKKGIVEKWPLHVKPVDKSRARDAVDGRRFAVKEALELRARGDSSIPLFRSCVNRVEVLVGDFLTIGRRKSFPCAKVHPLVCTYCALARIHLKSKFILYRHGPLHGADPDYILMKPWDNPFFPQLKNKAFIFTKRGVKIEPTNLKSLKKMWGLAE